MIIRGAFLISSSVIFIIVLGISYGQVYIIDTLHIRRDFLGRDFYGVKGKMCYSDSICVPTYLDNISYADSFLLRWCVIDTKSSKNNYITFVYCSLYDFRKGCFLLDTVLQYFPKKGDYAPRVMKLYVYKDYIFLLGEDVFVFYNGKLYRWNRCFNNKCKWTSSFYSVYYQPFGKNNNLYLHTYECKIRKLWRKLKKNKYKTYKILTKYNVGIDVDSNVILKTVKRFGRLPKWNNKDFNYIESTLGFCFVDTFGLEDIIYEYYYNKDSLFLYSSNGNLIRSYKVENFDNFWVDTNNIYVFRQGDSSYYDVYYKKDLKKLGSLYFECGHCLEGKRQLWFDSRNNELYAIDLYPFYDNEEIAIYVFKINTENLLEQRK